MDRVKKEIGYYCDEMKKYEKKGKGITVAVVDTGIAWHPDLTGRVQCFCDFVNNRNGLYDDSGHGTHVAGILAGDGRLSSGILAGMAPETELVIVKVLNQNGEGKIEQILRGLQWIKRNQNKYHIRIVNISAGTEAGKDERKEMYLIQAVEELWNQGLIVIVSAGNLGPKKGSITVPGTSRKVITVGALRAREEDICSGKGPTRECVVKPDVLAPGYQILSCNAMTEKKKEPYTVKSGTSMATPVVAGAAAILLSEYPEISNVEMKLRMCKSADFSQKKVLNMEKLIAQKYF